MASSCAYAGLASTRTCRHTNLTNPAPPSPPRPVPNPNRTPPHPTQPKQGAKKGGAVIRDLDAEEGDAGVAAAAQQVAALSVKDEVGGV